MWRHRSIISLFYPRTCIYDFEGSLNTLKTDGTLYDVRDTHDDIRWYVNNDELT